MNRRALVTGATGFLGRHVCASLRRRGYFVTALGRQISIPPGCNASIALADIVDGREVAAAVGEAAPDLVIHLAGVTQAPSTAELYRVNTAFGATLVEAVAATSSDAPVVLVGTAAEYGPPPSEAPISESLPCQPVTAYGISKYAQTLHGLSARKARVVVGRPFNPVGAGMGAHLALGSFIQQIAAMGPEGGTLLTGDLSAERDFIDAESTADLLVQLGETPAAIGQAVNICSGRPTRLQELVEALIAASGKPIALSFARPAAGNSPGISRFLGDPSRLRQLGLTPPSLDVEAVVSQLIGSRFVR